MPVSACAAVGSWSCFGCVTRSLARALRRMLALGEAILLAARARAARACNAWSLARASVQAYGTLLRCLISSASQRRSCLRAVNRTHSHAWSAGLRNTISGIMGPALLPGLARRQGKVAPDRSSRLCRDALGPSRLQSPGVQSAESCERGHKTTSRDPQEDYWTVTGDTDSACQNRFCSHVGGQVLGIDCVSNAAHAPQRAL